MPEPLVLIIDDEESMRDACTQILLKNKYRIATAGDGAGGLQKIRDLRPDAVIVDLKMPGTSGFEVLENLRLFDPRIMAIVITGYATVDSAVEAMKKGAYDFLPKPFSPEELRVIIARAVEHRRLALEAEALRREKKLLEENVITMVSHQLRSPLVAIQQYFEVILSGLAGDVEEKPKEMIGKARERLDALLQLINDWLDLARIDKGKIVGKLGPVDLRSLLEKLIEFLNPVAQEYGVSLVWAGSTGPTAEAFGDKEMLEQVFSNLLSNAIKYNKLQGRVNISLREDPDCLVVEIQDTGIGISQEQLPLIFDQFFQISRGQTKTMKGSGLGLSIAKKIVEAHNGQIDVTSTPGEGSTFTVRLPKAPRGELSA